MNKFQGVLLATDFDDTLMSHDGVITKRDTDAAAYFMEHGGSFTVATGRAYDAFLKEYPRLTLNAPAIISNGAVIYDFKAGGPVITSHMPLSAPEDFTRLSVEFPQIAIEVYASGKVYEHNSNEISRYHLRFVGAKSVKADVSKVPLPWTNLLLEERRPVLEAARAYIEKSFSGRYEAVFSNPCLLEVTAPGGNKGGAVLKLAQLLGISRENIYCAGDNENDVPMLLACAKGFAPANAVPAAKAAAWRTLSPCGGCIADAVEILDELYQ